MNLRKQSFGVPSLYAASWSRKNNPRHKSIQVFTAVTVVCKRYRGLYPVLNYTLIWVWDWISRRSSEDNFSRGGVGLLGQVHICHLERLGWEFLSINTRGNLVLWEPSPTWHLWGFCYHFSCGSKCRSLRSPSMWKEPWFLTLSPTLGAHKQSHLAHNLAWDEGSILGYFSWT